ncbi:hypothetical protein Y032_0303g1909 [Ancylostoma ceylanicum]|uniref:Uncharacterized protein n=1 Tax=Ancylostoma ceylanicum TaxID=53326 RepID=A0A016S3H5_9BILA|nr:hypothetical protein Y032_0303g1909 [Ancylostoma ceylanicum]
MIGAPGKLHRHEQSYLRNGTESYLKVFLQPTELAQKKYVHLPLAGHRYSTRFPLFSPHLIFYRLECEAPFRLGRQPPINPTV